MTDATQFDERPPVKIATAKHGWVVRRPDELFGYYAWPSVARMDSGELAAVSSGGRFAHVCPWGRTALFRSADDGDTWTAPEFVNNSPLDDRDAGIVSLGGDDLLLTWFSLDLRKTEYADFQALDAVWPVSPLKALKAVDDGAAEKWAGSWMRLSHDGGRAWGDPVRMPVSTPHGPARLADGTLLYLGKTWDGRLENGPIRAIASTDGGRTWTTRGDVPCGPDAKNVNYHEPHVVELPDGRLLGLIRSEPFKTKYPGFHLHQTLSSDRGLTWSPAENLGIYGSPPHLLSLGDGSVLCVYTNRIAPGPPSGIRARVTRDGGRTWGREWTIRDDSPSWDCGYPASVRMPDGSIFTVYYFKGGAGERCSIAWSRWSLPDVDE